MATMLMSVPEPGDRARKTLVGGAILVAATVTLALWGWGQGAERRAILRLPAAERAQLFRRELDDLKTLCGNGPRADDLEKECTRRAELIVAFPECDEACQQLAYPHTHLGRW